VVSRIREDREARTGMDAASSGTIIASIMTSVEITLPDSLFAALRKAPHEVPREMRIAAAIHWYQQSAISMERAAETAGMSRAEFLAELARRHVDVFVVDEEDLARELN
jgi:predicted HTH domain antitoxin